MNHNLDRNILSLKLPNDVAVEMHNCQVGGHKFDGRGYTFIS